MDMVVAWTERALAAVAGQARRATKVTPYHISSFSPSHISVLETDIPHQPLIVLITNFPTVIQEIKIAMNDTYPAVSLLPSDSASNSFSFSLAISAVNEVVRPLSPLSPPPPSTPSHCLLLLGTKWYNCVHWCCWNGCHNCNKYQQS